MALKDLETKRSLRKKYRDSKEQLKYTQKKSCKHRAGA